ncbi:hypothetical protein RN001_007456 [Aquatica leii]|uniref:Uncharacterized protein n=1 Tax=Aquatica leii TaxID=1421715 RepID=A0AAN7P2W4_9COLE|nr:hypothetical protein RN001_007456 [Aquatica leii]
MLRFLVCKCIVIFILVNLWKTGTPHYVDEYSWREYDNYIPHDAYLAGRDASGNRLYFGQALYDNKLIPGKIIENSTAVVFEYFAIEHTAENNIKILCAQNPQTFEWVPTNANDIRSLEKKIFIKGGYEPLVSSYLGRTSLNGIVNIGKIICTVLSCHGLYVTNNGATQLVTTNFEILSYNANINNSYFVSIRLEEDQQCKPITVNIFK